MILFKVEKKIYFKIPGKKMYIFFTNQYKICFIKNMSDPKNFYTSGISSVLIAPNGKGELSRLKRKELFRAPGYFLYFINTFLNKFATNI